MWLVIFLVIWFLVFFFVSRSPSDAEGYWSLPLAGGDVIVDDVDPHKIEGPIGHELDRVDGGDGGEYPL